MQLAGWDDASLLRVDPPSAGNELQRFQAGWREGHDAEPAATLRLPCWQHDELAVQQHGQPAVSTARLLRYVTPASYGHWESRVHQSMGMDIGGMQLDA